MVLQRVFHKSCILEVAKPGLPFALNWFLDSQLCVGPIAHTQLFSSQDSSEARNTNLSMRL